MDIGTIMDAPRVVPAIGPEKAGGKLDRQKSAGNGGRMQPTLAERELNVVAARDR